MSSQQYENNSAGVTPGACSYASLSHYNNGARGLQLPVSSLPQGQVPGTYVVPVYSASGYSTLVHGNGCCSGYPDIGSAYRSDGSCNPSYQRMNCSGN